MSQVTSIQMSITNEGLENIATMIANGTIFNIFTFRLTNLGDAIFYENKKSYTGADPDSWYMPYSAADFNSDHPTGIIDLSAYGLSDSDGFITINSVELADPLTVEINCYIPPGTTFTANEIMCYSGSGTLASPYRSFIWGIFPEITKVSNYGINFRILLQL